MKTADVTPQEFITKWKAILASPPEGAQERALSQQHFLDVCSLIGHQQPHAEENFRFEKPVTKVSGEKGFADVWKRGFFGWEYKGPHKNLDRAYVQLKNYSDALENPPLMVVSDLYRIRIHTNFTNSVKQEFELNLDDLGDPAALQKLRGLFFDPEKLRPVVTRAVVTKDIADKFAGVAQSIAKRYDDPQRVAHFINRVVFSLFAEDIGILPERLFSKMAETGSKDSAAFTVMCRELFTAMAKGGRAAWVQVAHFNGGLFDSDDVLELTADEIAMLREAAKTDWSQIEPAIFGTLFERFLDPDKRAQLGAHFTDPATIMRLVLPVVLEPLEKEWAAVRQELAALMKKSEAKGGPGTKALKQAQAAYQAFLKRLSEFRVLDPACGSGNFLYLSLRALKDFEKHVRGEAALLGLQPGVLFETGPHNLHGIEINRYAAELARVSIWIGEIQWMIENGYGYTKDPILGTLEQIETRDAVLNDDGSEASWPSVDAIVGNPPFLGNKRMIAELGEAYTNALRSKFQGRLPGGVELVIYWFEKARGHIESNLCLRAGLVATQAIRKGANRVVLDRIVSTMPIFEAWRDEPWINEGAAVRVSLVAFGKGGEPHLDGQPVVGINADLSPATGGLDITRARSIPENVGKAFQGPVKVGAFDIPGDVARKWLQLPNPNGRPNSDVLRPWANGQDLTGRPSDTWIIDFGGELSEADAALYQAPFAHVLEHVKPMREAGRREGRKRNWWRHGETVPALRSATASLSRYLATPRVAKHRFFVWLPVAVLPDSRLYAICREDDYTFGVLSSRFHEVWSLANGSRHGVGNDPTYNARDCFETFAFPLPGSSHGLQISETARQLDQHRQAWLYPLEWGDWMPEIVAGYPDRFVPKEGYEGQLRKRTLTILYNEKPAWLQNDQRELDQAVAAAYGWTNYTPAMSDEEILRRLLELNISRTGVVALP